MVDSMHRPTSELSRKSGPRDRISPMSKGEITVLLAEWCGGDQAALDRLLPLVYGELHRIAGSRLRAERPGHTLQPTALIHEAYLRMLGGDQPAWKNRAHFYGVAARVMRQILCDHARKRLAAKRGWVTQVALEHAAEISVETPATMVALDDALEALSLVDDRKRRTIDLRYFGGLSIEEISAITAVSVATVGRDLRMAEAWLGRQMKESKAV